MEFKAKRIKRHYRQTIDASPEVIFPLLCPVREAEWLDGWQYRMIYSESGLAEKGAVFSTSHQGEQDTVWVITKQDPENHEIQFARFTPESKVCVLDISVMANDPVSSFVDITYTYTGITKAGNEFIDKYTDEEFLHMAMFWEKSMNHWLKTGDKLLSNN